MNDKSFHFISGLPRSGSTLLSAILKQNPAFYADIASPLCGMVSNCIDAMTGSENNLNLNEDRRKDVLHGLINGYYKSIEKEVIVDSSRTWTAKTNLIKSLFPTAKIICCVRDVPWVLDSFERIASKNSLYTNTFIESEANQCVTTRCDALMDVQKGGQVVKPWFWLQEGYYANPNMMLIVEYENLCRDPENTMKIVYGFLGMEPYEHDYDNVAYENEMFDRPMGQPGLHTVHKKVEWKERETILPPSVWKKYSGQEFWRVPKEKELKYS
jgi:sulfotransferase